MKRSNQSAEMKTIEYVHTIYTTMKKREEELTRLEKLNRIQASELQELRLRLIRAEESKECVEQEVKLLKNRINNLQEELLTSKNKVNEMTLHNSAIEREHAFAKDEIQKLRNDLSVCQSERVSRNALELENNSKMELEKMEIDKERRLLEETMTKLNSCRNENRRLVSYGFCSHSYHERNDEATANRNIFTEKMESTYSHNNELLKEVDTNEGKIRERTPNITITTNANNAVHSAQQCESIHNENKYNNNINIRNNITERVDKESGNDNNSDIVEWLESSLQSALYTIRRYEDENRDLVALLNNWASRLAGRVSNERLQALLLATMIRHPLRFELSGTEAENERILNDNKHFISFLSSLHTFDRETFNKLVHNLQDVTEELINTKKFIEKDEASV